MCFLAMDVQSAPAPLRSPGSAQGMAPFLSSSQAIIMGLPRAPGKPPMAGPYFAW